MNTKRNVHVRPFQTTSADHSQLCLFYACCWNSISRWIFLLLQPQKWFATQTEAEKLNRDRESGSQYKDKKITRAGRAEAGSTRHSLFLATVVLCASPHNHQHDHNWLQLGTSPYLCVWDGGSTGEKEVESNSNNYGKDAGPTGSPQRSVFLCDTDPENQHEVKFSF